MLYSHMEQSSSDNRIVLYDKFGIQALKTLGRSNVTPEVIQMLSEKLTAKDKQACLKEATESTDWVYDTIRQICGGEKVQ